MTYKALTDIGDFKKGGIVPDEIAEVWLQMYKIAPVELVGTVEPKTVVKATPVEKASDDLLDDYLSRNEGVVKANVKRDRLSATQIKKLIALEQRKKRRFSVIRALKNKLKA